MKKGALLLFFILFISFSTKAQSGFSISAAGVYSIPTSDFKNLYNSGGGGFGAISYMAQLNTQVLISVGYIQWKVNNDAVNDLLHKQGDTGTLNLNAPVTAIPVLVGLKYFIQSPQVSFRSFILLEAGIYLLSSKVGGTYNDGVTTYTIPESTEKFNEFALNAGIGMDIPLASKLDVELRTVFAFISDSQAGQATEKEAKAKNPGNKTVTFVNISAGLNLEL